MNISEEAKELLQDFELANPDLAEIVHGLRNMIIGRCSKLDEGVKYGGIVYMNGGTLLGGLFMSKKHVSLEFSFGCELNDKFSVLEGKGKYRRHLKFRTLDDIDTKNAKYYIEQSMK